MIHAEMVFKIDPLKGIEALKSNLRNKAIRIAINKAAAPLKAAVISNLPTGQGFLKKAIRIKVKNYNSGNQWAAIIGASTKYKRTKGKYTRGPKKGQSKVFFPSRYLNVVEGGSKRYSGRHPLGRALSSGQDRYFNDLANSVAEQIAAMTTT